jgi:hypothetical protein
MERMLKNTKLNQKKGESDEPDSSLFACYELYYISSINIRRMIGKQSNLRALDLQLREKKKKNSPP